MWRLLTSDKLTVTMRDLEEYWSFDDIQDAHDVLDALEKAAVDSYNRAKAGK